MDTASHTRDPWKYWALTTGGCWREMKRRKDSKALRVQGYERVVCATCYVVGLGTGEGIAA